MSPFMQCCGAGAGGTEIILRTRSRNQSRIYLFRLRLCNSGAEIIFLLKILVIYCTVVSLDE